METETLYRMYIGGVQVNYYFVCKTKLWLFSRNITMEHESELVKLGRLLHRETFSRDSKDVRIGPIALDVVRNRDGVLEIKEVKKTSKLEKAHIYQTLYYLYFLEKIGLKANAVLSYPSERKIIHLELDEDNRKEIEKILKDINTIIRGEMPKPTYKRICRKCAYFEFCFS